MIIGSSPLSEGAYAQRGIDILECVPIEKNVIDCSGLRSIPINNMRKIPFYRFPQTAKIKG